MMNPFYESVDRFFNNGYDEDVSAGYNDYNKGGYSNDRDRSGYTDRDRSGYTDRDRSGYTGTSTGASYGTGTGTGMTSSNRDTSTAAGPRQYRCSYCQDRGGVRKWPAMDVIKREADYLIRCDVPGVNRGDIKVMVSNEVQGRKVLTISGERKDEQVTEKGGVQRMERTVGRFERCMSLPYDIDEKGIKAKYENGELCLTLPRNKEAQPQYHQIKID